MPLPAVRTRAGWSVPLLGKSYRRAKCHRRRVSVTVTGRTVERSRPEATPQQQPSVQAETCRFSCYFGAAPPRKLEGPVYGRLLNGLGVAIQTALAAALLAACGGAPEPRTGRAQQGHGPRAGAQSERRSLTRAPPSPASRRQNRSNAATAVSLPTPAANASCTRSWPTLAVTSACNERIAIGFPTIARPLTENKSFAIEWMTTHLVEDFETKSGSALRCKGCHCANFGTPQFQRKIIASERLLSD
jgi:hypothetical protein